MTDTEDRTTSAAEPGSADRPLVTFALFAYNQEKYIREAVEGAFAQTYEPLEIILSDDCSTDGTFEIMQEMAAVYRGPHKIRLFRNKENLGVTPHVLRRCREANGEIVVLAAGDDISLPNRAYEHVKEYVDQNVFGVSGAFDLIDEKGTLISERNITPIGIRGRYPFRSHFLTTKFTYIVIQGSTASYRRALFDFADPPWKITFSEDNFLNFLIYAKDLRVSQLDKCLVRYRCHPNALSNRKSLRKTVTQSEIDSLSSARRDINRVKTFLWFADQSGNVNVDRAGLLELQRRAEDIILWPELSICERFRSAATEISAKNVAFLKWKCSRLFGSFPHYQPKLILSKFQSRYK